MKINELLDAAKNANGLKSNGELAERLGLNKGRVSEFYSGTNAPNEFVCLQLAQMTNKPLDEVIAIVRASAEKDGKRREAWENYMKRLGGLAASFVAGIFLLVTLIVTSPDLQAKESMTYSAKVSVIQIMRDYRTHNFLYMKYVIGACYTSSP